MVAGLAKIKGTGWSIGGVAAAEQLADLNADDKLGAVVGEYHDWDFIVHLNNFKIGHSCEKIPLPKNKVIRALIAKDMWGTLTWDWSVQGPNGQVCTSNCLSRSAAITKAKDTIDDYIKNGRF
jgi:hypothetical protein